MHFAFFYYFKPVDKMTHVIEQGSIIYDAKAKQVVIWCIIDILLLTIYIIETFEEIDRALKIQTRTRFGRPLRTGACQDETFLKIPKNMWRKTI